MTGFLTNEIADSNNSHLRYGPNVVAGNTMICKDCQTITLKSLLKTSRHAGIYVRSGVLDFRSDSMPPCPICRFLISVAQEGQLHKIRSGINDYRFRGQWPLGPRKIRLLFKNLDGYEGKYEIVYICVLGKDDTATNTDGELTILGSFDLRAELGSYAAQFIKHRLVGQAASHRTFEMVRSWLKECDQSHKECALQLQRTGSGSNAKFPTRIIDVGSDFEDPRLLEIEESPSRYVTLSHCWGGKTNIATTRSNVMSHMMGIKFSTLSKTFQDAITITRTLGIQYLWIDALCIIQDDVHDWRAHAEIMGLIFEQSYCTIAATFAPDGSVGCWAPRTTCEVVPVHCDSDKPESGYMYFVADPEYHNPLYHWEKSALRRQGRTRYPKSTGNVEQSPLNNRAWVLQERILSRRILHFADDQVYWECNQRFMGEDAIAKKTDRQFRIPTQLSTLKGEAWLDVRANGFDPSPFWNFRKWWFDMVSFYTSCNLTNPSDRLPALKGLANILELETGYKCYDGVFFFTGEAWSRNLLWCAADATLTKANPTRTPSWSWASLDGPIDFMDSNRHMIDFSDDNRAPNPYRKLAASLQSIGICERYGLMKYHTLQLWGVVKEISETLQLISDKGGHASRSICSWPPQKLYAITQKEIGIDTTPTREHSDLSMRWNPFVQSKGPSDAIGWICFDTEEDHPCHIYCTPLWVPTSMRKPGRPSIAMVLILARESDSCGMTEYRRLGVGEIRDLTWFEDSAGSTFVLV